MSFWGYFSGARTSTVPFLMIMAQVLRLLRMMVYSMFVFSGLWGMYRGCCVGLRSSPYYFGWLVGGEVVFVSASGSIFAVDDAVADFPGEALGDIGYR